METCFVNVIEPGDEVVVCVNGVFGTRMSDIVNRICGKLIRVDGEWGRAIDPEAVGKAVQGKSPKVLAVVHAETSTGVCQPLEDLARIARESGALFLVDIVTSLGGMEVALDSMNIDVAYSGTQKCISCPPGLSPISFSPKAMEVLENRKTPVVSWYLDMSMVSSYWGAERKYHHTAPVNMIYGLREALRIIAEEGLETRFARHQQNHKALVAGVEAMGLSMLVPKNERLPMLNAVRIPAGADDLKARKALLSQFGIEIGGGLGDLAGKIWRVGLMGHASRQKNVFLFLSALETVLKAQGVKLNPGALEAAAAVYGEG
jgi:alanine-glyoxylate transaminase/serine-glyoxylate transaminase/serine-pyruvate transaminase